MPLLSLVKSMQRHQGEFMTRVKADLAKQILQSRFACIVGWVNQYMFLFVGGCSKVKITGKNTKKKIGY